MTTSSLHALRLATASSVFLFSAVSAAHIDLLEPEARAHGTAAGATADDDNTNQKTGPCGQVTNGRTDRIATYAPGETITVRVAEETPHDSYIRVSLDLDGDTFPLRPVVSTPAETEEVALAAEQALGGDTLLAVVRETNNTANFVHEIPVTLPTQTCTNCTLQVVQFMYGAASPFYFQCADLVISGDAVVGGGSDAGAGPVPVTSDAGAVAQGAGGSLGTVPAPGDSSGTGGASGAPTGLAAPGAGGTAVTGAAGSQSAGTGGGAAATAGDDDDGGCSLPASGSSSHRTGLFAVLALGLALLRRRS